MNDRAQGTTVSCIIVTWNGWDLLRACLESLTPQVAAIGGEIIVVDNASTDHTRAGIGERFPDVRYLQLESNAGFAAANNRGADVARGDRLFLVNNDTVPARGALDALIQASRTLSGFDIFAPQMIRLADPDTVDNRGVYVSHLGHCRQLDAGVPVARARAPSEIFGASGGACLIRRAVVEHIGLFDEALGSYQEDCEFAFRARAAGYRCAYVPESHILHVGSGTGSRFPDKKLYQIERNLHLVRRRWIAPSPLGRWLGLANDLVRLARAAPSQRSAIRQGWRDARDMRSDHERWATPDTRRSIRKWIGVRARSLEHGA